MFPVARIRSSQAEAVEYLGTKAKFWYRDGERQMLFKAEERGTGEDWAEKIACELCAVLGLPHVHYEMAYDLDQQRPGVVCASITSQPLAQPKPLALVHGNQLLLALDPAYPAGTESRYRARAHTVDAVFEVVELLGLPDQSWCTRLPPQIQTAVGIFAGYLLLDAWIANQDRHHENWGAIWDGERLALAPSFDHGAALARNLSDEERHERLTSRDDRRKVPYFAGRARSALFATPTAARPLGTLAAWQAFAARVPGDAAIWRDRLASVEPIAVEAVLDQIPPDRMSAVCRRFTLDLLAQNRRHLLQAENP